jgi:hypothetical protein
MKYLYIFKKQNGEYFLEEETLAYKHIYQSENYREKIEYIGRFDANEFTLSQNELIDKVKEFKRGLLENKELQKAINNGNITGSFTSVEEEYAKKVQEYSVLLDKERMEKFLLIAKKEFMDKDLNISTPGGNRAYLITQMR